ncbi:hypothetical protein SXCC_03769 [Gluconacetobacter sp. SXCC-1]|nr:hypothetical protein SXCC_03769 [Gluconacetobacter sp. SXCC-1]
MRHTGNDVFPLFLANTRSRSFRHSFLDPVSSNGHGAHKARPVHSYRAIR